MLLSPWKHSYNSLPGTNLLFLVSISTHWGTGKHLISIQFAWIGFCGVLAVWNPQLGWKLEVTMFRLPFFPRHQIMDTNPFALLLPPTLSLETEAFLFVYWTGITSSPASDAERASALSRFPVKAIQVKKKTSSPEHEFLLISVRDSQDSRDRNFILERTVNQAEIAAISMISMGTRKYPIIAPSPTSSCTRTARKCWMPFPELCKGSHQVYLLQELQ